MVVEVYAYLFEQIDGAAAARDAPEASYAAMAGAGRIVS